MPDAKIAVMIVLTAAASVADAGRLEIAFESDRNGNDEIYLASADGERQMSVTRDPAAQDQRPVWSPDGALLAFMSDRSGTWDIHLLDVMSREVQLLVSRDVFNVPYGWSPDGRWISFHATSGRSSDSGENCVVSNDGSQVHRLVRAHYLDTPPIWSPDGSRVALVSSRQGNPEIYLARLDGSQARNVSLCESREQEPAWSPDGKRLAFVSWRDGNAEIYVVEVAGGVPRNVTASPGADTSPSWAPDSCRIAFSSERDGNWEIYIVDVDGGEQLNVTRNPADDTQPAWRPDTDATGAGPARTWGQVKNERQD